MEDAEPVNGPGLSMCCRTPHAQSQRRALSMSPDSPCSYSYPFPPRRTRIGSPVGGGYSYRLYYTILFSVGLAWARYSNWIASSWIASRYPSPLSRPLFCISSISYTTTPSTQRPLKHPDDPSYTVHARVPFPLAARPQSCRTSTNSSSRPT
jgi:hypothetical protein